MKQLDQLVVLKGWASSREEASSLILSGRVLVNGLVRVKPSTQALYDAVTLTPDESEAVYVSRGGQKLDGALSFFGLDVTGSSLMDLGASTGGFTHCLLLRGADQVWAVDIGSSQLDVRLREDPRVVVYEGVNVRWPGKWCPEKPLNGVVADLSFISLRKISETVFYLLQRGGFFLPLFKPQFEAEPKSVGKGGIVRDRGLHRVLLSEYIHFMVKQGARVAGVFPSTLTGRKGNQEYFILFLLPDTVGERQ
ncbi:MAG: TlyA family RNA methyltransferase [Leptospirales bacterium]